MMPTLRQPAVAGRFYPEDTERMARELAHYVPIPSHTEDVLAVVLPHAGWMFSATIAGAVLTQVNVPERVVVMCPNHTGLGSRRSVWARGSWQLPGCAVPVD